ncbi:hypothetical protein V7122_25560, partial [Bacillus sp. JJ1532]|uniref:hypothetical protein n=1 Tax=Bacillus sp. JJ1532 TaxID=3122958 RepID=UPI002FFF5D4E
SAAQLLPYFKYKSFTISPKLSPRYLGVIQQSGPFHEERRFPYFRKAPVRNISLASFYWLNFFYLVLL